MLLLHGSELRASIQAVLLPRIQLCTAADARRPDHAHDVTRSPSPDTEGIAMTTLYVVAGAEVHAALTNDGCTPVCKAAYFVVSLVWFHPSQTFALFPSGSVDHVTSK